MKYLDEYRDERIARGLVAKIARRVTRPWVLMEICGGQTHTLMRFGIDELLPKGVEMVHGPGCPVCVTPLETIDKAIDIASQAGRDADLLRRHAARARVQYRPLSRESQWRRRAHRLRAHGSAEIRARESRPPGGVLRRGI